MFERIPEEMRRYAQWVVWRLEHRDGNKPTKIPYCPRGNRQKASVTDPNDWGTWEQALEAYATGNYSGIGFVLTRSDPYAFVDLDNTHGDLSAHDRQRRIFGMFDSYSELSPSGEGLHIIVKGVVPTGRRRSFIEVYSSERYMTMTGNVYHDAPIAERQPLLDVLYNEMGGPPAHYEISDKPQTEDDAVIIERASSAANGDKFQTLYAGDWSSLYPSQSEADFALVDIIAFYTQNRAQIARIFRASNLGQRDKAQRNDYVAYMVNKAFDRQLPPVDVDGFMARFRTELEAKRNAADAPGGTSAAPVNASLSDGAPLAADVQEMTCPAPPVNVGMFPPGLIGEVAAFIYQAAPRPVPVIALAGAIGLVGGITGRAFNISGTGVNQYVMLLAPTGTGKEAIQNGVSKLMNAIKNSVPASADFIGPGEIRSDAALLKWLAKKPTHAFVSMVGEIGLRLKQMSSHTANSHELGLKRVLLDLYNKSGQGNVLNPMAYSDTEKNTDAIQAPAFTLLGESTPERFYGALDEGMISEGLLPRFTIIEYRGLRPRLSPNHVKAVPPMELVDKLANLAAQCLALGSQGQVINVTQSAQAAALFEAFDRFCDDQINERGATEVTRHLWNRAHIKSLKLAALLAIGINPHFPVIDEAQAKWATDMIAAEVRNLLARFEAGEIGEQGSFGGNEITQIRDFCRIVGEWLEKPHAEAAAKYGVTFEMHRDGVIPFASLTRRLAAMASFRGDRIGATNAIKRAYQHLLDGDDVRELPKSQVQMNYGQSAKAFVISKPTRFVSS